MKPIEGWELINEAGEFKRLPAGIYGIVITKIVNVPEKEYLEIYVDIARGEYKDYFKQAVQAGLKDTSKTIRSYKDSALAFFKAFITAVQKSNKGYVWDWDEQKLVGKKAIGIFGEEEYLKDGQVKISTKLVEIRSIEAFEQCLLSIPPLKKLTSMPTAEEVMQAESNLLNSATTVSDPEGVSDDDWPF